MQRSTARFDLFVDEEEMAHSERDVQPEGGEVKNVTNAAESTAASNPNGGMPLQDIYNGAHPGAVGTDPACRKHTKKMSVSFPVLVPTRQAQARSSLESPVESSPSRLSPAHSLTTTVPSATGTPRLETEPTVAAEVDFLTLLATQERKVLELREELQRAEAELVRLKKTWAERETAGKGGRSHNNGLNRRSQSPARRGRAGSVGTNRDAEEMKGLGLSLGLERRKTMAERGASQHSHLHGGGRKTGQRVFSGSRHARTLSLLAVGTGTPKRVETSQTSPVRASLDETSTGKGGHFPEHVKSEGGLRMGTKEEGLGTFEQASTPMSRPSLSFSRTSTLPELGEHIGKTYKDLAGASRRSLPPVSGEVLVRQGQRFAEGVKEGLWSFFEDIRQATVGEEGVSRNTNGQAASQAGPKGLRKSMEKRRKRSIGGEGVKRGATKERESVSFWKEFGVETPAKTNGGIQSEPAKKARPPRVSGGGVSDAATVGACMIGGVEQPDLLLHDQDEHDDEWEAWESPTLPAPAAADGARAGVDHHVLASPHL